MEPIWQLLADHHGFTTRQIASVLGMAPSSASRLLTGQRQPRGETLTLMERVLALGRPRAGEQRPLSVLVLITPDGDLGGYLPDDEARPAVFGDRENAVAVAELLARFGLENVAVVPMWSEHVDALYAARTSRHPLNRAYSDRTFTLDAGDTGHQRAQLAAFLARTIQAEDTAREVEQST